MPCVRLTELLVQTLLPVVEVRTFRENLVIDHVDDICRHRTLMVTAVVAQLGEGELKEVREQPFDAIADSMFDVVGQGQEVGISERLQECQGVVP